MLIIIIILKLLFIKNALCENVSLRNDSDNKPFSIGANLYTMKAKICGIYKITSPKKRIYIGQSTDIENRKKIYRNSACKKQTRLYRSIKKYGWEKHKFEIIHFCEKEELNDLEVYYISLFQTNNTEYGLNLKSGGGYYSEEIRRAGAMKRVDLRGVKQSPERAEMSRKALLKAQAAYMLLTKEQKSIPGKKNGKKTNQFDLNYNLIKEWESQNEAARYYKVTALAICNAVKNGTRSCNNYWNFAVNPISKEQQEINRLNTQIRNKKYKHLRIRKKS